MRQIKIQVSKSLASFVVTSHSGAVIRADKEKNVIYSSVTEADFEYPLMMEALRKA